MINVLTYEAKEKEELNEKICSELKCDLTDLLIKYDFIEGKFDEQSIYTRRLI